MACFGVRAFREILVNIYEARKRRLDVHLLPAALHPGININSRVQEIPDLRTTHEERLAVTFKATLEPKAGRPMVPRLFTNKFYDHDSHTQEDVMEFLLQSVLNSEEQAAPLLGHACRGMDAPKLQCKQCTYHRGAAPEAFNMLNIPVTHNDGSLIYSVQDALQAYFQAEDVQVDWCCLNNACALHNVPNRKPNKFHQISIHPQVLVLGLVRWRGAGAGLLHAVVPEREITLQGTKYALKSILCHVGETISRGHYTCRIHFPTADGTWWYYNDSVRRLATEDDLRTSEYEKSYVLMYEKVDVLAPQPLESRAHRRHELRHAEHGESMSDSQPLIREIEQVDDSATPMMPDAGDTSATDIEMESPPESTGPNLVSTPPVSTRSGLMPSMSRSPSAAVTPTTFQTAPGVSANSVTSSTHEDRKPRIVTGFGPARVDDVAADEQRRLKEGARRGSQRRETGERGRMRDLHDNDLDRAGGSAWHAGKKS